MNKEIILFFWRFSMVIHWGSDLFELLPNIRFSWGRNGYFENQYIFQFSFLRIIFVIVYDKNFNKLPPQ